MSPPPTSQAEIDASNRYQVYMRGWRHGSTAAARGIKEMAHPTLADLYIRGYTDGAVARGNAAKSIAAEVGYDLAHSMLR